MLATWYRTVPTYILVCFFSNDKMLRIFDLEQPSEPIIKFEGHTSGIKQVGNRFKLTEMSRNVTLQFFIILSTERTVPVRYSTLWYCVQHGLLN